MSRELDLVYFVWSGSFDSCAATYREVAAAGVRSVVLTETRGEFDLKDPTQAAEVGRLLHDLGLQTPACHGLDSPAHILNVPDDDHRAGMVRDHVNVMTSVAALGCRTYVLHLGPRPAEDVVPAAWEAVRRAVDLLAPEAERLGITLALENGFVGYQASNAELLALVTEIAHPAVGICYDSGHAHMMGDAAAILRDFSPQVVTVHLHDNDGTADQHLLPGHGTLAWPEVAAALAACPRLIHAETEAANCTQWAHTPEVWPHRRAYEHYVQTLNLPGSGTAFR